MAFTERLTGWIARVAPVKRVASCGKRPVASITFDDFPRSAWTVGGALLAKYGARGTYYTAGSALNRTIDGITYYTGDDLHALHRAGHEIGCHGYGHEPTTTLSTGTLAADAGRNAKFLGEYTGGEAPVSYAFPFGDVSLRTKMFYARRFSNARGVHPGVNDGWLDLAQLRTVGIETYTWDDAAMLRAVAHAKAVNGWIVFHTHDVSDNPSRYGCTPAMLESVLKALAEARIEALPMREALRVATGETP